MEAMMLVMMMRMITGKVNVINYFEQVGIVLTCSFYANKAFLLDSLICRLELSKGIENRNLQKWRNWQ